MNLMIRVSLSLKALYSFKCLIIYFKIVNKNWIKKSQEKYNKKSGKSQEIFSAWSVATLFSTTKKLVNCRYYSWLIILMLMTISLKLFMLVYYKSSK